MPFIRTPGARAAGVLAVAATTALAACGGDSGTGPLSPEDVQFNPALGIDLADFERLPSGVYIRTVAAGSGDAVASGDRVVVDYALRLVDNSLVESSPPALDFTLGSGRVIPGFDIGVTGMRVGEERRIIIPSALGYGGQRAGAIPPNSVLIFDVSLTSVGGAG